MSNRLKLVYLAGLVLNIFALVAAATAGQLVVAVTFGIVIVYLCFRYWLLVSS
ncbi:hypothetical protein ACFQJ7_16405 [Halovenus rubra]|uniref:Uncharacterized protein n=2 Tax=Halovenus rubra TaxID=869890 RepID=A0ACC7DVI8_9EURY|nr:hypothetical protein [Halovenus rubra]